MFPGEAFDLRRARYGPPLSAARQVLAAVVFFAAMGATLLLLWFAHTLDGTALAGSALGVIALLWAAGELCTPRAARAAEAAPAA
jgi:hypothetical protein